MPLQNAPGWLNVLLIVLLGALVPLGSLRVRRWRSLLDALALPWCSRSPSRSPSTAGLILAFVYPLLALVLGTLGTLAVLYVGEAIEREHVATSSRASSRRSGR